MFPLLDMHLYLGFNFHICNYFMNQHKQITTPVNVSTKLLKIKKNSRTPFAKHSVLSRNLTWAVCWYGDPIIDCQNVTITVFISLIL